jgi:hypothetical protein
MALFPAVKQSLRDTTLDAVSGGVLHSQVANVHRRHLNKSFLMSPHIEASGYPTRLRLQYFAITGDQKSKTSRFFLIALFLVTSIHSRVSK